MKEQPVKNITPYNLSWDFTDVEIESLVGTSILVKAEIINISSQQRRIIGYYKSERNAIRLAPEMLKKLCLRPSDDFLKFLNQ
jgi:hypothetical protein